MELWENNNSLLKGLWSYAGWIKINELFLFLSDFI